MTSRLLVVGGGGFIGRHIVAHGLKLGWDVVILGISGNGLPEVRSIACDIANGDEVQACLRGEQFDYVVNCGGYVDHALFTNGGRRPIQVHFFGLLNLIEGIDKGRLKRFVNIGSSDEYGGAAAPQSEKMREAPISPYSQAKVAATHFLQMMHRTEAYPGVTLRLFLTYGPGQDSRRFLPQIIKGCLAGKSFQTSSGEQLRDFCYVDDTVRAVFSTLHADRANGEVINIASGERISIRKMIEMVCRMVGSGVPQFGAIPHRTGENMALYADVAKAKSLLDWTPQVSLEDGLRKTIAVYRGAS